MKLLSGLLFTFTLVRCASSSFDALAQEPAEAEAPVVTTTAQVPGWTLDTAKFIRSTTDTLYADRYQGPGRRHALLPLTDTDRITYLQRFAPLYTEASLYFCSILDRTPGIQRITILAERNDDQDLLWLNYDRNGRLNGLDTLISSFGDGQEATTEIAYRNPYGTLMVAQVSRETFRDEQDTMAYLIDTLLFESGLTRVDELPTDPDLPPEHYSLIREPRDLTRHWMELSTYSAPTKIVRRSLMQVVPPGKTVFQTAIGDLNGDGWNDSAPEKKEDPDGPRDLQLVFTDRELGFVQKALAMGLLPDRHSGGFHDPIGEPGISGISIESGHLVIARFEGSAWKSESRQEYTYAPKLDGFYLTMEQGRSYHAPTVEVMDEELARFEAMQQQGEALSTEEVERVAFLRKMKADYMYKPVYYPIGEKPLSSWKY